MTGQKDPIAVALKWLAVAIVFHALVTSPLTVLAVGALLMPEAATSSGMSEDHRELMERERASSLFPLVVLGGVVVLFGVLLYAGGVLIMRRRRPQSLPDTIAVRSEAALPDDTRSAEEANPPAVSSDSR